MRNLPLNVHDKRLKEICITVAGRKAFVKKVLSKDRVDSSCRGRSMGYGFVEFTNHNNALAALRANNNNPDIFGADRRPIVEFSLENSLVVKVKQRRLDKARQRQQPGSEQPKTNKEKRLEKNQKRKRLVTWLPCYLVTLLLCYLVTLLPCYLVTLLPCYLVTVTR